MFRKKYICVKQHDIKDCGAACLATISKTHGLKLQVIANVSHYVILPKIHHKKHNLDYV